MKAVAQDGYQWQPVNGLVRVLFCAQRHPPKEHPPPAKSMARKRILEILSSCDHEGTWQQCTLLAAGLPPDEWDVHFCLLSNNRNSLQLLKETRLPVHVTGDCRRNDLLALWPLIRLVKKLQPDIIHSWNSSANRYGSLAARICGTKTIFCNTANVIRSQNLWNLCVDRLWTRQITKLIVPSRAVFNSVDSLAQIPKEKLVLIPPAIPLTLPKTISRSNLLQTLRLPEDSRLIATSDPLQTGNRMRDVVWATELLKVAGHNIHVFICGDGPQRESLEKFRNRVHLEDRIHFLKDHKQVDQIMQHLDIFWKVSGEDGSINQIIETMRRGVVVIAGDSPAHQELIRHEQTGYLVPEGNRAALASWTQLLLEDSAQAKRIGTMAQQVMANQFDPQTAIEKQTGLYRESLSEHPHPA